MTEKFKHGSDVHQHELKRGACFQCRYTLQYTYPYAYYLEKGARKNWFESEQAQLEAEVENLSWKVERAEITDRGVSRQGLRTCRGRWSVRRSQAEG